MDWYYNFTTLKLKLSGQWGRVGRNPSYRMDRNKLNKNSIVLLICRIKKKRENLSGMLKEGNSLPPKINGISPRINPVFEKSWFDKKNSVYLKETFDRALIILHSLNSLFYEKRITIKRIIWAKWLIQS